MRFVTHRRLEAALVAAAAVVASAGVPAAASAAAQAAPVVGHVYVNDNTVGTNTIGVFDRHADGTLTPHAGSPFAAGGAGTGAGLASQGALQISPDGRFLIAVDAGSNQISVLRIKPDGSLSLVPGGVASSGGVLPVSVAIHGGLVYVPTPGPAAATTPASGSAPMAVWHQSPARPSPCLMAPSPVTCCSMAPAASLPAPGWGPPRSTASPLALVGS